MLDIPRRRLHHQRIDPPAFNTAAEVVRWMGAMQAQDYHQAVWAVAVRTPAATLQDIEQAIAAGEIIRTWPQRGTIHFVPPEDARWMLSLSAARMIASDKRRLHQLELDEAIIERARVIFYEVMQDGRPMARPTLLEHLETAGIPTKSGRGYHILWHLAQLGHLCLGPVQAKEQTFVLLDKWAPHSRTLSRDEALGELARRYFTSHAPATVHDFAWWSGLTVTEARAGLEAIKAGLVAEKIDGKEYWLPAASVHSPSDAPQTALLPGFDEYLLGYKDRAAILDPQHANKVCPGANGIFFPMIVLDGQVVGTWKRTLKKDRVVISRESFDALSAADTERFESTAQRYGAFHGLSVVFG
jgi:hypothetical protein